MTWFFLAFLLYLSRFDSYPLSLIAFLFSFLVSYFLIKNVLRIEPTHGEKITYTPKIILLRGLLGGTITALAVFMGKIGGPVLGGIFPAFPGIIASTVIIAYFNHGKEFSRAIAKNALLGLIGLVIYSIMVRYTYLSLGIFIGTLLSIFVSFLNGYLLLIAQKNKLLQATEV
jgi:uncharacterized membrane protein (GlpM family)